MPDDPQTSPTASEPNPPSFEVALGQIEAIVSDLERGTLDLDASLERYERGVRLLAQCRTTLQTAERRVALLTGTSEEGDALTTPFDDPSALAADPDDD
ncbi:exodeoxyribonuclease VII small subunit [Tautonia rosea]|uniref:exodeoxyribonuclease VII small subunit n=1 Tax=Tautonia rosea TaxID=2728037 RepID=UPI0014765D4E|nr:exodeoxyribonuclease VII small subunit [Tautonia rosea]